MNTLPAELQLEVLGFALSVPGSSARQRDRLAFRKVCATWRELIKPWKEIEVIGFTQLNELNLLLTKQKMTDGLLVQSIYIELLNRRPKQSDKLKAFLDRLPNLIKLEFTAGPRTVSGRDDDSIGRAVEPGFLQLREVTEFIFKAHEDGTKPSISFAMIKRYASSLDCHAASTWLTLDACRLVTAWPNLRHLSLLRCYIAPGAGPAAPLALASNLTSLSHHRANSWNTSLFRNLLGLLPSSLRSVFIVDDELYRESPHVEAIRRHLQPIAHSLKELSLVKPALLSSTSFVPVVPQRGVFDPLIANLTSVERLVIEPSAVNDLGTLAALTTLEEVTVRATTTRTGQQVIAEEVVHLLGNSSSLQRLALNGHQMMPWDAAEWSRVEQKAQEVGIELVRK